MCDRRREGSGLIHTLRFPVIRAFMSLLACIENYIGRAQLKYMGSVRDCSR